MLGYHGAGLEAHLHEHEAAAARQELAGGSFE
jgi:hypothetical protein